MLTEAGIDFEALPEEQFDNPMGESTGAADIFGVTGGVIEAALRTAYEWLTGKELEKVDFHDVRGLGNARKLLKDIQEGKAEYHAIEIMSCPGGCIDGGGQPYHMGEIEKVKKRMEAIYKIDREKSLRKSHESPYVKKLYEEYLGEVGGKKAYSLLHTHFTPREKI